MRLGDLDRALDRGLVAGNHDLPAAIVIGRLAHLPLRRLGCDLRGRVEREPKQRRHGADADRDRRLHGAATNAQQARGIRHGERTRRGKRGIFPERMSGHERRVAPDIELRLFVAGMHLSDDFGRTVEAIEADGRIN